jgi:hypothetical protein
LIIKNLKKITLMLHNSEKVSLWLSKEDSSLCSSDLDITINKKLLKPASRRKTFKIKFGIPRKGVTSNVIYCGNQYDELYSPSKLKYTCSQDMPLVHHPNGGKYKAGDYMKPVIF